MEKSDGRSTNDKTRRTHKREEHRFRVEMKELSFIREGRPLLDMVSIEVEEKSVTVVVGIAGSGKTTLLKAAAGLLIPDSGALEISGKNLNSYSKRELLSLRKKDGFVFQDAALWENKTIEENLALPIQFHYPGVPEEVINGKIDYWIKRTGFWDSIKGRPAAYSMGERKMISFIRALITEPRLLFLDNPTELLDTSGIKTVLGILAELKKSGVTMLISSQHPEILGRLADKLIVIDEGKIIECGSSEQIFTSKNETTRKVMKHVRDSEGIDYNELMDSVESVLDEQELIDINDIIDEQ